MKKTERVPNKVTPTEGSAVEDSIYSIYKEKVPKPVTRIETN